MKLLGAKEIKVSVSFIVIFFMNHNDGSTFRSQLKNTMQKVCRILKKTTVKRVDFVTLYRFLVSI
jgi:hypothetical protein